VTTHLENLENLEKSGNSKVVREKSGKMEKVGEKSGKLTFVSSCNQYTSNTNRLSVKSVQYVKEEKKLPKGLSSVALIKESSADPLFKCKLACFASIAKATERFLTKF